MRAGRLKHRGDLQSATETEDAYGEQAQVWATYATRWMAIEPLGGREILDGQQIKADLTHRVLMRGGITVEHKHRIKFGDRILNIEHIRDRNEVGAELELLCIEEAE